ncbi:hypothetical protein L0F63_001646, partial [Massospora cicadina]
PSPIMEEAYISTINSLRQECQQSEKKIEELRKSLERLDFEKQLQVEDLSKKLWKANHDYSQLFNQFQANQSALEEAKRRTNLLEAENVYLHDQLRYAAASESDIRQSATHYFEKANHLEFNIDYKNYLLSNQQELYERDVDLRADLEYFKTVANLDAYEKSLLAQAQSSLVAVIRADPVVEPKLYSNVPAAPTRSHSFGRCQREAGKASRILSMAVFCANSLPINSWPRPDASRVF